MDSDSTAYIILICASLLVCIAGLATGHIEASAIVVAAWILGIFLEPKK